MRNRIVMYEGDAGISVKSHCEKVLNLFAPDGTPLIELREGDTVGGLPRGFLIQLHPDEDCDSFELICEQIR